MDNIEKRINDKLKEKKIKKNKLNKDYRKKIQIFYPNRPREYQLKYKFGITVEQYNQMFVEQNGTCLICHQVNIRGRYLVVDHNHKTGKIRGLLCYHCNNGLGQFKDNIDSLLEAAKYLSKN